MSEKDLNILITNDDGINAEGLRYLEEEMRGLGKVTVVAPHRERSASSHSISLNQTFQIAEVGEDRFALKGTPADCVMFAIKKMLPKPPDLVLSGINPGGNLGEDVIYSGTVAGAREGSMNGITSFAISLLGAPEEKNFRHAAVFTRKLVLNIKELNPAPGSLFNVNIPESLPTSFRFTSQSFKRFEGSIEEFIERGMGRVYRVTRGTSDWKPEPESDLAAVSEGVVSVTPLHCDQTDYRTAKSLIKKALRKEGSLK